MFQLRSDQSQHILAAAKESGTGSIVDFSLGFVEAFLFLLLVTVNIFMYSTYKSVLLATRSITSVRLQEAAIDELQVCLDSARLLSFALWSECNGKYGGKKEANDTESDRELMKGVTRNEG